MGTGGNCSARSIALTRSQRLTSAAWPTKSSSIPTAPSALSKVVAVAPLPVEEANKVLVILAIREVRNEVACHDDPHPEGNRLRSYLVTGGRLCISSSSVSNYISSRVETDSDSSSARL